MFWARLDAISPILDAHFGPDSFEREKGPIDGTLAHTLERIFSLCSELDGKKLYEVGPEGLYPIAYKTDTIPEWSDLHPNYKKPEPAKKEK
jgi:hypothetical protein